MTTAEKIRSNIAVHGLKYAGKRCACTHIPFDTFYYVIFGRYPK